MVILTCLLNYNIMYYGVPAITETKFSFIRHVNTAYTVYLPLMMLQTLTLLGLHRKQKVLAYLSVVCSLSHYNLHNLRTRACQSKFNEFLHAFTFKTLHVV